MKHFKNIELAAVYVIFIIAVFVVGFFAIPSLKTVMYTADTFDVDFMDTLLPDNRNCGNVNLQMFVDLASRQSRVVFNPADDVKRDKDSVTISTRNPSAFFGVDGGKWWKTKYKDLPVSFPDAFSFRAAVHEKNGAEYIYIPYQILYCLASSVDIHVAGKHPIKPNAVDKTITLSGESDLASLSHDGSKIQTGGRVFEHVSDVLLAQGGKGKSNYDQLKILWNYARGNWMYVTDPFTGSDTWRSATETINVYYACQSKGYSGDCDDFAILMASFARQVGFDSHVVAAFKDHNQGGHAYAEFKYQNNWVPLDWFSDRFGGTPYQASRRIVLSDI